VRLSYMLWRIEMKLAWSSDIHLNFLGADGKKEFYQRLEGADAVLITGDIAEAPSLERILGDMPIPVYFVAGNHDYYMGGIKECRKKMKKFDCAHYLPKNWGVKLNDHTALVGQDGWGDGRNGDYENSRLTMSDWLYIKELKKAYLKGSDELLTALQEVADGDAERLAKSVLKALSYKRMKRVIIATHVPPFEEVCLNAGQKSTPGGLCFFSSQILGKTLLPIIESYPKVDFLWLCGHTHSRVRIQKRSNLTVKVAEADYYLPKVEDILEI
jgi:predicted phosphohydrolase